MKAPVGSYPIWICSSKEWVTTISLLGTPTGVEEGWMTDWKEIFFGSAFWRSVNWFGKQVSHEMCGFRAGPGSSLFHYQHFTLQAGEMGSSSCRTPKQSRRSMVSVSFLLFTCSEWLQEQSQPVNFSIGHDIHNFQWLPTHSELV